MNSTTLQLHTTGHIDVAANLSPLLVDELGELRAEFRFDDDAEPRHVATLVVVDVPFSMLPPPAGAGPQ